MDYIIVAIVCFAGGSFATFIALHIKRRQVQSQYAEQKALKSSNEDQLRTIGAQFDQLRTDANSLEVARKVFEQSVVSYRELANENVLLKTDLQNIGTNLRKLHLDRDSQATRQSQIDSKIDEVGRVYLKESVKWISKSLNANNFSICKQRLIDVVTRCRDAGVPISAEEEASYTEELRLEFEQAVRAAFEREEQARIRAQIREEQKLEREIQREQVRLEREKKVLEEALATALAMTEDKHSAEIESLRARLADAESKERAMSQAQLTKAGFVYVISNIGSFGDGVFKVGMTRRLEPLERVRELGDASVPFPFDVHMMISCENAPSLENALHKQLFKLQLNKTNPRKEFFRTDIETIASIVRENHGEVEYVADPEALQYRQSLSMPEDDQEFIEHVFDELEDEGEISDEEPSIPIVS